MKWLALIPSILDAVSQLVDAISDWTRKPKKGDGENDT